MAENDESLDLFIAQSLAAKDVHYPADWTGDSSARRLADRIVYHGVAALVLETSMARWPDVAVARLKQQHAAQILWEIRHKDIVMGLLSGLGEADVRPILLKGTALAYTLYPQPEARPRGDTDLLVCRRDLAQARHVLAAQGFTLDHERLDPSDRFESQESWVRTGDNNSRHFIDLHWEPLNALALHEALTVEDCMAAARPVPRLGANAWAPDLATALFHAALHRACHTTSPYVVGNRAYFGANRLIWGYDMKLLSAEMSAADWDKFVDQAAARGVVDVCLDGLRFAETSVGASIPPAVTDRLARMQAARSAASRYLTASSQPLRALEDLRAIGGFADRTRFIAHRLFPPANFMRAKYPWLDRKPLFLLYLRRLVELFAKRTTRALPPLPFERR